MDDVLVGSRVFCDSCIFVLCVSVTWCHSQWYREQLRQSTRGVDVELRVIGQHVAVNIKNPNRSWVHNLGPQQKATFLPWAGVLKGGLGSIRGVALGHLARTKMSGPPEQFWVVRLLEDIVDLVHMEYPLSVIRGLVHSLLCSRVAQIGRKTVRTWLAYCKERMVLDDKKGQRQKPRHGGSGTRRGPSGGARDSGWRIRGRGSVRKSSSSSSSSASQSRKERRGKQQKVKEVQKLLEKCDPHYQQWKEEAKKKERAVELEQTWSSFECLAELLEFACVESEGSVVLLVRLTILGPVDRVHK